MLKRSAKKSQMSDKKPKKIFLMVLLASWLLTLGFHITNSWVIYRVVGQDPNNWLPPGKPHISYLITQNEKSIGVPLLLTCQFDEKFGDFRFYVETDDSDISDVIIQSLDVTYDNSESVRICENQACEFDKVVTPERMSWNPDEKDFKFSFVAPKSIRFSNNMKVLIKYSFKRKNGQLEEFEIENERQYRKRTNLSTYWMAIFEGVGTGGV